MKSIFNRKFYLILGFIFLAELLSFFCYLFPNFNNFIFLIIIFFVLILTIIKLEYGLWFIFAELFIGSKGYLFFFENNDLAISIRIALWLVIIAIWFEKVCLNWIKNKKLQIKFLNSSYVFYFLIFFFFIFLSIINGFLNNNNFSNIFFDFNNWLYFILIFPIYAVALSASNKIENFSNDQNIKLTEFNNIYFLKIIIKIFIASMVLVGVKTFFLLFVFSHNIININIQLYRWVHNTGIGEITKMSGGFYRIFFQSHIFILIGFFILLIFFAEIVKKNKLNKKNFIFYLLSFSFLISIVLISFSRSFWVGIIIGLLFYGFIVLRFYNWKVFLKANGILLISGIISILFIASIVKFPFPSPIGDFNTTELLSKRATQINNEAGVSSRWSLLPVLWKEIKKAPILGKGFGTTLTYKSNDPRILQSNLTGEYTTYAFEWGWLDVWLKLGIFGLLSYLALIFKMIYDGLRSKEKILYGMAIGLFVIFSVNIFSPYMNHPLGIGYLLIFIVMLQNSSYIKSI